MTVSWIFNLGCCARKLATWKSQNGGDKSTLSFYVQSLICGSKHWNFEIKITCVDWAGSNCIKYRCFTFQIFYLYLFIALFNWGNWSFRIPFDVLSEFVPYITFLHSLYFRMAHDNIKQMQKLLIMILFLSFWQGFWIYNLYEKILMCNLKNLRWKWTLLNFKLVIFIYHLSKIGIFSTNPWFTVFRHNIIFEL